MRVRFKKDWFGPGEHLRQPAKPHTVVVPGHLYTKTAKHEPSIELPDSYRDLLHPSFATIVGDDDQPEVIVPAPVQTLASFDEERQADAVVEAVFEKAEANRVAGTRKPPRS